MPDPSSNRNPIPWLLAALAVLSSLSCSEELGPIRPPLLDVSGQVLLARRPIGPGWVEFQPVNGAIGPLRVAPLDDQGSFHASNVPVGLSAVRVVLRTPPSTGNPSLDRALSILSRTALIRLRIEPGSCHSLVIDLWDESLKLGRP